MTRRTHRSFVSYIDKSREYYAAQGYEHPYRWAVADTVAFAKPRKPLSESRIAVVITAHFPPGEEPDGVDAFASERPAKGGKPYAAPSTSSAQATQTRHLFWAKDETHTDDINTYLPIELLHQFAADGHIGSVSERFYGVPTGYSQQVITERDGPLIRQWMHDDEVDLALLIPL